MTAYLPLAACFCILILLCVAWYTDVKTRTIPNAIPLLILLCGCGTAIPWLYKFASAGLLILILVISSRLTKEKSGGGDIKLYIALSFALGVAATALLLAGTIVLHWVSSLIRRHKHDKKERLPVAAYLAPVYLVYFTWMVVNTVQ